MGTVTRSLAIASLFPRTMDDPAEMARVLRRLSGRGYGMVEFYSKPGHDEEIGQMLRETGFASIFIAVYALKGAGFSLCAVDEKERCRAVEVLCASIDRAAALGCQAIMINSGFLPEDPDQVRLACASYVRSVLEAYDYTDRKGYTLQITLEPGDSHVQSMQLLGPTDRVLETTEAIRAVRPGYGLTMDVAHLREEGEEILPALLSTLPHCHHVHLCNCLMNDPSSPLYGDKHVDFDCPGACFGYADFERMHREIGALYGDRDYIITLEILCRAEDNDAWFDEVARRCAWMMGEGNA